MGNRSSVGFGVREISYCLRDLQALHRICESLISLPKECPAPSPSHTQVGRLAHSRGPGVVLELAGSASPGDSSGLQSPRSWPNLTEAESGRGRAMFEQVPQVILEQLKLEKPLKQASTNLFCKGPLGNMLSFVGQPAMEFCL